MNRPKRRASTFKPARIVPRGNFFYFSYYDSALGYTVHENTGVPLDLPAPKDSKNQTWWRKSRHAARLSELYGKLTEKREAKFYNLATTTAGDYGPLPTLEALMTAYNEANARDRDKPLSDRVIESRRHAMLFLRKFYPEAEINTMTREDFVDLREKAKKVYAPKTVESYFIHLKALWEFAVQKGYIPSNVAKGIVVRVPPRDIKHIALDDELKLQTFLYHKERGLLMHLQGERLFGFRVNEGCKFILKEHINFATNIFRYWNAKAGRWEDIPMSKAQRLHAQLALETTPEGEYLYPYRNRKTVSYYLTRACEFVGIPKFTSHDLKRAYVREIAKVKPDPRTFDLACHHSPTVNITAVQHYMGRDLELLHETLEAAQAHWVPFIEGLPATSWDETDYKFSNPKSSVARKKIPGYYKKKK